MIIISLWPACARWQIEFSCLLLWLLFILLAGHILMELGAPAVAYFLGVPALLLRLPLLLLLPTKTAKSACSAEFRGVDMAFACFLVVCSVKDDLLEWFDQRNAQ